MSRLTNALKKLFKTTVPGASVLDLTPPPSHQYVVQSLHEYADGFVGLPNDVPRVPVIQCANEILKNCCRVINADGVDVGSANIILELAKHSFEDNIRVNHYVKDKHVAVITYIKDKGYQKVSFYPLPGPYREFVSSGGYVQTSGEAS